MKAILKRTCFAFPIAVIISFIVVFLGYLRPNFDIILYSDNIEGEGIASTYVCSDNVFSPFYRIDFYFGSQLKQITIKGIHYDVNYLRLTLSDVTSAELDSYDVLFHGIKLGHFEIEGRIEEGEYYGMTVSESMDGKRMRFSFTDPDQGTTLRINTHFPPLWFVIVYSAILLVVAIVIAYVLGQIKAHFSLCYLFILNAVGIMTAVLAGCFFCGSLPYVNYTDFWLNCLLLYAGSLLLSALTLPWLGTVFTMAFTLFWYIANYFVIIFRNKPIMPADLKAIGTAAEVMGSYNYMPSWKMIIGAAVVICYAVVVVKTRKKYHSKERLSIKYQLMKRVAVIMIAALMIVFGVNTTTFKSLNSFAWDAMLLKRFHKEGMVLTYLKSALDSGVKRPEGYSREAVEDYLSQYQVEAAAEGVRPTRIIMVMNEAFSDLRTVGLDDWIDVMPFVDSLDKNTIEGSLYVGVYGGGTCNTEFEGLTGGTLAFLSNGAYPYTENVTSSMFSLASYFRDSGYITEAFHANEPQNWNRNMVYPNLGFEAFHSMEDYNVALDEIPTRHKHPADEADYAYMEQVDGEQEGAPRFLFNVTMQNHSGYERWEDVEKDETVMEYGADLAVDAQVYLSLVKASDEAVKQLVETYRDSNEPTMIVFFGDHQPGLPQFAQDDVYTEVETYLDWYKSKFFIWTNYETETEHDVQISANYLPWLILERGNFPLPPYVQMLREVHEKYPVISAMGVIDAEGNIYSSVNDVIDDLLIQKYQFVQYANLFDEIDPAWFETK